MKNLLFWLLLFLLALPMGYAQQDTITTDTALARCWLNEAKDLLAKGKNDEAEPKLKSVGEVFEKVLGKESVEYADVLHQMGRVWMGRSDYDRGIKYTQEALELRIKLLGEENLAVGASYNNLGVGYISKGDYDNAIKNYEKSLLIRLKMLGAQHPDVAASYNGIGGSYYLKGDFNKAIENHEKALSLRLKLLGAGHLEVANSYNNLGASYNFKGDYDKAIENHEKALLLRLKLLGAEYPDVAWSYYYLGVSYHSKGDYGKAVENHEKALLIRLKLLGAEHPDVAESYYNLGIGYESKGDHDKAIENHEKAVFLGLRLFGAEHPNVAWSYHNLGVSCHSKGDYGKAIENHEKALLIRLKLLGAEHLDVAWSYHNLGASYDSKGDYGKAIENHEKALLIRLKLLGAVHQDVAWSYHNMGVSNYLIGYYDKAIEYSEKSLLIRLKLLGAEHPDVAYSYNNLGISYNSKGNYGKAIGYYEKSLSILLKLLGAKHPDVARSYGNLGVNYNFKGDYDKAIEYHFRALSLLMKLLGAEHPDVAQSYLNLGNSYYAKKDYDKAKSNYFSALETLKYQKQNFPQVSSLGVLLDAFTQSILTLQLQYLQSSNPALLHQSLSYAQEAIAAIDYQSSTFNSGPTKTYWQSTYHPIYAQAIDISLLAADVNHNDSLRRQTFTYAEKSKATQLQAQLKNADALAYSGIPDSLTQQEYQLRVNLSWREKQRQGLLDQDKTETDSTVLRLSSILFDLRQQYDTLKSRFEKNYPDYYRLKYDLRTVPLDYIQDSLLQPGQTLLEYFVGDSSIYLFLVQPKNYEVIKIKKDTAFNQWVEDLTRNGIYGFYGKKGVSKGKSINNFATSAYKLYETLIAPVKAKLPKDEKLIIIPDGILGYVPFEALLTEKPPRPDAIPAYKYLIQDHQISYCYSATLLKEMRNKKHRQEPTQKLLAMAPFFLGNADTLLSQVDSTEFTAGISLRDTLTALPNSGEEVARIQKILKGQAFYGKAATLAQFQKLAAQARILHLSTHGKADDRLGDYAYLAFGTPNKEGTFDKLYARDLYNLSLNADLVVLSACETGIGKLQRGEGIVSLARAFAYAGAKSIVTTLWKVSDEQSKNLMTSFYKYLSKGKDKDEALRLAKLEFLQKNESKTELLHPFFWASFINIGDTQAIK